MGQQMGPPPGLSQTAAGNLAEIAKGMESISLVDLGGEDASGPTAAEPSQESPTSAVDLQTPGEDEAVLELDLEAAGLQQKPKAHAAPAESPPPSPDVELAERNDAPATGDTQAAAPKRGSTTKLRGRASPAPAPERVRLLGQDPIAAGIAAVAIGLVLGLLVGSEVASRVNRDQLEPLHAELEEVVSRPLASRAGEIRTTAQVKSDLDQGHEDARSGFLLYWILTALPIAGALFFIRRPG